MLSELLALLGSSNLRPLFLIFMPATIIGMFILPSTSLLLMEDNTTFDTNVSDEEVKLSSTDSSTSDSDCSQCHSKADTQLHNSPVHRNLSCIDCHNKSSSTECEVNRSKIECMECHQGYHPAGGFGLTANSNDTGSRAAHIGFIGDAMNDSNMLGANEACIACHTHTPVKINWTHRASLDVEVVFAEDNPNKHFDIASWDSTGTANTTVWQDKNNKTLNFSVNLAN